MSSNNEYEQQKFWKQSEMAMIDLSKSTLPIWYPDINKLKEQMLEYICVPEDRLGINFKEIK